MSRSTVKHGNSSLASFFAASSSMFGLGQLAVFATRDEAGGIEPISRSAGLGMGARLAVMRPGVWVEEPGVWFED
ncbi:MULTISPECIES: hypothetical protein [Burkholderiaceae]|uniref:hypothetical protein n=1 Tax=Burkholderiaceae TaxID=119060 RepID=UPI000978131D|nr:MULTISPECIES: hypothetical protein [Burkholderiaceae]MCG1018850.1 hypothetical protein [Mycetohabitans sp. B4]